MNSGVNANSESIMPLTINYSSTAKVAIVTKSAHYSHNLRKLSQPLLDTIKFITAYERNKNLKDFLCSSLIRN